MKSQLLCAFCLFTLVLFTPQAALAGAYNIYNLGVAPGYDGSYGDYINNLGIATCLSASASDCGGLFIWSKSGGMVDLSGQGIYGRINDSGQMTGYDYNVPINGTMDWFIREADGSKTYFATSDPVLGFYYINNSGQTVGGVDFDSPVLMNSNGTFTPINVPQSKICNFYGLNDVGQVVIETYSRPVLRSHYWVWGRDIGLTELQTPDNSSSLLIRDINNSGYVVGFAYTDAGMRAFKWNLDGSVVSLGQGYAYGINDLGQIVGATPDKKPIMWDVDGTIKELSMPDGADHAIASQINNLGQIVGTKYVSVDVGDHIWHRPLAVMWDPVPEPCSLLSLVAGMTGTFLITRRRRR